MKSKELLRKLSNAFVMSAACSEKLTEVQVEEILDEIKKLWLIERPIQLHTLN